MVESGTHDEVLATYRVEIQRLHAQLAEEQIKGRKLLKQLEETEAAAVAIWQRLRAMRDALDQVQAVK